MKVKVDGQMGGLTSALRHERNDVARHKDLGHPRRADQRVLLRAQQADQAREDHVDGRGQQRRAEQDEQRLHDVDAEREVGGLLGGDGAADIAERFDCGWFGWSGGYRPIGGLGDNSQVHPRTKGIKYQTLLRIRRKTWPAVRAAKRTTNTMLAARLGS